MVKTFPADGAVGVPASVKELKVYFDQPVLTSGWSFVQVTQMGEFPKLGGNPRYQGDSVCILPVELKPFTTYAIGVNSQMHLNFRLAEKPNRPCLPHVFIFRTGK